MLYRLTLLVLVWLVALPASAVEDPPAAANIEKNSVKQKARAQYDVGRAAYNLGDFEGALAAFSTAYQLSAAPELLFNLGQCHKNLNNHERALFFFNAYLREVAQAQNKQLVEVLISESETALAEQKRQALLEQERTRSLEIERQRQDTLNKEITLAQQRQAREEKAREQSIAREPSPVDEWWFWPAVTGTGAAVVIAGVVTAIVIANANSNSVAAEECGSLGCLDRR